MAQNTTPDQVMTSISYANMQIRGTPDAFTSNADASKNAIFGTLSIQLPKGAKEAKAVIIHAKLVDGAWMASSYKALELKCTTATSSRAAFAPDSADDLATPF